MRPKVGLVHYKHITNPKLGMNWHILHLFLITMQFISFIINFWSYLCADFLTETLAWVWFLTQSISEVF